MLWGLDFRKDYRRVCEIVCLLDEVPTLMLTATATNAVKADVCNVLAVEDAAVIARLPNRPNIFLHLLKVKENFEEELSWLIGCLKKGQTKCPKILVYCRNVRAVYQMYMWVMEELGDQAYAGRHHSVDCRLVEMFHSKADQESMERIMTNFPKEDSHIRLLFATIAFGMGVQINDVDIVVHWGLEQSALQYWQEVGRCARDGRPGLAVTYALSRTITTCKDKAMKEVATCSTCCRVQLLQMFAIDSAGAEELETLKLKSNCEQNCLQMCQCALCSCCSNCQVDCCCPSRASSFLERLEKMYVVFLTCFKILAF
ncbi:PREDICTED: ATP-dependent DNA helicase RecQ-like, partial [Priapulus caudatus]|uniref:DNA 3'-5' helicase n=1 Tax=Priapulus caudatus TaxID=37621 RepID=A0ABM1EK45_PRICU